jgi:sorbitol/mannitol transport system substrate-binding protein
MSAATAISSLEEESDMTWSRLKVALGVAACVALSGCGAGGGGGDGDGKTVRVLMVNNPQMVDLQKLTAANFTKDTGIKVAFKVLPENDVRDTIAQDVANQAGQYDVISISNFEVPIFSKNGWLHSLTDYASKDSAFDEDDILEPMRESLKGPDGKSYGVPFYGESSMLMYRKDVFKQKGLKMPEHPTWQQVADLAAKVDGAQPGMRGICLRGLPGWGEVFAPLTTMVNTFGGTWFTKDWKAQVDAPEFKEATNFYVDLVRKHGESGAAQSGFTECLNNMSQGKVAMWYDATSAAGSLENKQQSKVAGKIGYAYAPVKKTKSSGWLYTWAWGIEKASKNPDDAWKFVSWASSKEYQKIVGEKLGWAKAPDGTRQSLYDNPEYQKAAGAFYKVIQGSIASADPTDPGVQPRPTVGIQFVDIPEFTKLGTDVSQFVSSAIAGKTSVDEALSKGQDMAEKVAEKYQGK